MRAAECYAEGIHSFFINFGLDAIERDRGSVEAPEGPETVPGRVSAEDGMDFGYSAVPESCYCLAAAYPPCSYCEHVDDDGSG